MATLVCENRRPARRIPTKLRWGHSPDCIKAERPAEIQRLYVRQAWHGKGIAQDLMAESIALAKASRSRPGLAGGVGTQSTCSRFLQEVGLRGSGRACLPGGNRSAARHHHESTGWSQVIERPKPGAASTFQKCTLTPAARRMRRIASRTGLFRAHPAAGTRRAAPANRGTRTSRPTRRSTNPARHTFRSAARAFFPAARAHHSAPSPRSATRAFCSTRRAGEPHAPSFFSARRAIFSDRRSYFPRPPSARAWRPGEFSRPPRLFSPRPECRRPPAGKIPRHARLFVRALQLGAELGTWRTPSQGSIDPRWAFPETSAGREHLLQPKRAGRAADSSPLEPRFRTWLPTKHVVTINRGESIPFFDKRVAENGSRALDDAGAISAGRGRPVAAGHLPADPTGTQEVKSRAAGRPRNLCASGVSPAHRTVRTFLLNSLRFG